MRRLCKKETTYWKRLEMNFHKNYTSFVTKPASNFTDKGNILKYVKPHLLAGIRLHIMELCFLIILLCIGKEIQLWDFSENYVRKVTWPNPETQNLFNSTPFVYTLQNSLIITYLSISYFSSTKSETDVISHNIFHCPNGPVCLHWQTFIWLNSHLSSVNILLF